MTHTTGLGQKNPSVSDIKYFLVQTRYSGPPRQKNEHKDNPCLRSLLGSDPLVAALSITAAKEEVGSSINSDKIHTWVKQEQDFHLGRLCSSAVKHCFPKSNQKVSGTTKKNLTKLRRHTHVVLGVTGSQPISFFGCEDVLG